MEAQPKEQELDSNPLQFVQTGISVPASIGISVPDSPVLSAEPAPVSRNQDFNLWLLQRASALRSRRFSSFNWDDVAEELEAMAKADERALTSHLKNLLEHLLKWRFVASHRTSSWEKTIKNSRDSVSDLLKDSPSLMSKLDDAIETAYGRARRDCIDEMKEREQDYRAVPSHCPWPFPTFMSPEFWPSGSDENGESGLF